MIHRPSSKEKVKPRFFALVAALLFVAVTARVGDPEDRELSGTPLCAAAAGSLPDPLHVIIVGAGMAGLTAAKTLADKGKSFIVVERLDQVGGRMRSIDVSGHGFKKRGDFLGILEAGANWMNGGRGVSAGRPQPIKTLADQYGVKYYDQSFYEIQMFDEGGEVRWNKLNQELQAADKAFNCLSESGNPLYDSFYAGSPIEETQSAKITLEECGWFPEGDPVKQVLDEYYYGAEFLLETDELSSFNFPSDIFADFGAGDSFASDQQTGIQGIPIEYSKFLTKGQDLFLNTKVGMIDYDNDPVSVNVEDSDGTLCSITAESVIYTPSLGILEAYKNTGFNPPINTDRLPLVMGTWTKVFFQFRSSFWLQEHQWIMLGTTDNTCKIWLNYDYSWNKNTKLLPGSNILACLMDEKAVNEVTGRTVVDVTLDADNILKGLKEAFGDAFEEYENAYATNWLDEEEFGSLGSWENWKYWGSPNRNLTDYYNFFEAREDGRLIISGSASCLRYWGLMTGAYNAGVKSAEWAINFSQGKVVTPYSICDDPN